MNKMIKFHISHLLLWLFVAIGFISVFITLDAINNWGDNSLKSIMLALLFLIGFGGDYILRYIYRKRDGIIISDERDESIRLKAMEYSFILTMLYVFLITISIYTKYENIGLVPVGWLWFLAYSLVLVVHIFSSLIILIMYWKRD